MSVLQISLIALFLQAQPAPRTGSIEGMVVRMETGQPVRKAAVQLEEVSSLPTPPDGVVIPGSFNRPLTNTTTGVDGRFSFQNLKPGTYRVSVRLAGYVFSEYGRRTPNGKGTPITLASGQKVQDIRIDMMPAGVIAGRVTGENGEPVSRAQVQALKYAYQEGGSRTLTVAQAVLTDDRGDYRLFWLPPGEYVVCVIPTNERSDSVPVFVAPPGGIDEANFFVSDSIGVHRSPPSPADLIQERSASPGVMPGVTITNRISNDGTAVEEAFVPVYFPGVTDDRSAAHVDVRAGLTSGGIDIHVARTRVYRIRGVLENRLGPNLPVVQNNRATVQILHQDAGPSIPSVVQQEDSNRFEIAGVAPGSYFLAGPIGGPIGALVPVEVGNADVNGVRIPVGSAFALSGRVSIEGLDDGRPRPPVNLRLAEQHQLSRVAATLAPDGSFNVLTVSGDYQITVNDRYYLKSVRLGSQDGLSGPLHIEGPPSESLDVVIGADTDALEGRVVNSRQDLTANLRVVLVPDARTRTSLYRTAVSGSDGRFRIENVAPGPYKVFAWEDVEDWAWQNQEFMNKYEDRGKPVLIVPGIKNSIEVGVIPSQP
jgi:hypothetical protein